MKARISIQLQATASENRTGKDSMGEVIEQALEVTNAGFIKLKPQWIIRQATLAVCREIIRIGAMPMPFEVSFK